MAVQPPPPADWHSLGLDPRLLRALAKRGLDKPTPVQAAAIPRALEGKDIVARARTGSGKTLAYLLPALHRILATQELGNGGWNALILVPTRDLCEQVAAEARAIAHHCGGGGAALNATALVADAPAMARAAALTAGALIVSTPARAAAALREGWLPRGALEKRLRVLVLDEADLILSYGYEEDIKLIAPHVPRSCQCMLMSATSSADVEALTKLVLHNPTTLNLLAPSRGGGAAGVAAAGAAADGGGGGGADEQDLNGGSSSALGAGGAGAAAEISHAFFPCRDADERPLALLALLKLGLLRKKVLVFVNSADEGMRLRLLLESFGVRLALLAPDQPINSRGHVLASFNRGVFDYLIAVDDVHAREAAAATAKAAAAAAAALASGGKKLRGRDAKKAKAAAAKAAKAAAAKPAKDEEFGVTRGIDFKDVRTVVNYDLPASVQGYVHRVGRTGRAGQRGAALTLLTPADLPRPLAGAAAAAGLLNARGAQSAAGGFGAELVEALSTDADARAAAKAAAAAAAAAANGGGSSDSEDDDDSSGSGDEGDENGAIDGAEAAAALAALPLYRRLTKAAMEALRYRCEDVLRGISRAAVKEARAREVAQQLLNSARLKEYFEEHAAEKALLRHDKPLHRKQAGALGHLKHVPAYLKDRAMPTGRSSVGAPKAAAAGGGGSGDKQQQQQQRKRPRKDDPLKAIAPVFAPAGKRGRKGGGGGGADEELTELEKAALAKPLKDPRAKEKRILERIAGPAAVGNVRKGAKAAKQAKRRR